VYSPAYVTVSADRWSQLPEDVRQVLEETARETQAYVYATAQRMDTETLQALADTDIAVNEPDVERFSAASQAIYEEFGESVTGGQALLDHAFSLASD
jgi:TRAP-type C4-dicarboxylate transport system substrate-binding protein